MRIGLLPLFLLCSIFTFAGTVTESKTDGQFVVRTVVFDEGDREFEFFTSMALKYTLNGQLISRIGYFNEKTQSQKDMVSQEEIFNDNNKVEKYVLTFTSEYAAVSGIDTMIETVDDADKILNVEYFFDGKSLFNEQYQDRMNRFPFYRISYLKEIMLGEYVDDPSTINYGMSMKYVSATSMIKFLEAPIDIDEVDRQFISMYLRSRRAEQLISIYNKKALVQENGETYFIIFQDSLLPFIIVDGRAAVEYYFGTLDARFIMLSVGFTDMK